MNIYTDLQQLPPFKNAVITVGSYDGVHRGHRFLINALKSKAAELNGEDVLISFSPHPRKVIFPEKEFKLINSTEEKIENLKKLGLSNLVIIPFSRDFSEISPEQYISDFLFKYFHPAAIVIGYDHRFGRDRKGGIELFKKFQAQYHYELIEIDPQNINELTVSSTKIRNAISTGNIDLANDLLGYPYSIRGNVIKGNQLGRTIGFPTANIRVDDKDKLIPQYGVYIVQIVLGDLEVLNGILNIGIRPTVDGLNETIEVHIFDFDKDIYGEKIQIKFCKYLRPEMKFNGLEALKTQIQLDKVEAQLYFEKRNG